MCYRMTLVELQNKINKIEDKDPNYEKNKKWIKCRKQQNKIYEVIKRKNERSIL